MKWVKLVIFEHLQLASLEPLVLAILLVWLSLYSWAVLEPFFWMWVTAVFGIATKFFTATLSVLYRETGPDGKPNAGTMYIIQNGLPKYMLPLAYFFAFAGVIAGLPAFQANQVVQLTNDLYFPEVENFKYYAGAFLVIVTAMVVLGGLKRIANVSAWLVPFMGGLYLSAVLFAVLLNYDQFLPAIGLIVSEAFSINSAVAGGLVGVILTGIKRGAFSNEAGIGTEALIHGAAKQQQICQTRTNSYDRAYF